MSEALVGNLKSFLKTERVDHPQPLEFPISETPNHLEKTILDHLKHLEKSCLIFFLVSVFAFVFLDSPPPWRDLFLDFSRKISKNLFCLEKSLFVSIKAIRPTFKST